MMNGEFFKRHLLVCVLCFAFYIVLGETSTLSDVLCYKDSCEKTVCPQVNCTNGTLLTSPDYECGCCKLCFQYLSKDEACGENLSNGMCGPGLICTKASNRDMYCMKKNTTCVQAQYAYDARKQNGAVGMYEARPECDSEGEYEARKCTPGGSCYCINKDGKRIFGEGLPDAALIGDPMDCQCSRDYHAAQNLGALETTEFLHCLPNGNYDKLQCIGQACFCLNPEDQSMTSALKPITNVEDLPCFKDEMHYYKYFRPCEVERNKARLMRFRYNSSNITVLTIDFPNCTPDGYYHPIRYTESKFFCADPIGNRIEDFEIDKNSASAESMNCQCARSRYWLDSLKTSKPICCKNGNFRPVQCRGGVCFCVDEDGDQQGIEVPSANAASLSCYDATSFPDC